MKRMLAAGAPSIYSIGPVFRAGERGHLHNVEFTMLEWYEVGGNQATAIQLLGELAMRTLGHPSFEVRTYRQVFHKTLQIDPIDSHIDRLRELCSREDPGLAVSIGSDRDAMLDVLLATRVQPTLGFDRPVIIRNYPLSQAALARSG